MNKDAWMWIWMRGLAAGSFGAYAIEGFESGHYAAGLVMLTCGAALMAYEIGKSERVRA